jgi:hypothetical protein
MRVALYKSSRANPTLSPGLKRFYVAVLNAYVVLFMN